MNGEDSLKGLNPRTKKSDRIVCRECGKRIYVPLNPKSEINHNFVCSKCGAEVRFDPVVIID